MPYCFYCGKEIYLIIPFLRTKDCYCEHCQGHVSIIPQGQASEEELDRAKRDFQRNYIFNMEPGMTYKEVVNRMLAQKAYQSSIIMFHPDERDRDSGLAYDYDPKRGWLNEREQRSEKSI